MRGVTLLRTTLGVLPLIAAAGCATAEPERRQQSPPPGTARLVTVATGLHNPVHLASPPGDPRLFVVEQAGRILIIREGRLLPTPFLDIRDQVSSGGERGLLSVAFHPDYARNGAFFVNYTDRNGDTRVERYRVGSGPDRADPGSAQLVIRVEQPYANHNGGHILFGPDGMLWIGMGDGGSGGDPHGNGQNPRALLGKMLRLDVDAAAPYAPARGNPFTGERGRPEIWATGLRNPWRFAFDPQEGLLYVADVGQNRWEEVNVVPADAPGLNYGWNRMEGRHCYGRGGCDTSGLVLPVLEYGHAEGCSVTGGAVYRGRDLPGLAGHYFYSDYCQGWVRSFRWDRVARRVTQAREWDFTRLGAVTSFGTDAAGELYILTEEGHVYRLAPSS